MLGEVGRVLHRQQVGGAVALAGERAGALVLADRLLVRGVEGLRADLERVAEPAGRVVAPVLGRARRVVERVGGLVGVAVLLRHARAEVGVDRLVRRRALGADARRAQHQVGERVVGDQRRDLARGDQLADVLRLGLRERAGAAVGVVGRQGARARAAPEAAVVAVRVDAAHPERRRGADAAGSVLAVDNAAVAPLVGERRVDEGRRRVGQAGQRLVLGVLDEVDRRLAREVEAVDVDDRDHDRPHLLDEARDLRVAAVAAHQLERPLHRVLARGPLARVVDAQLEEDRLAVGLLHVAGDLDAVHLAALERRVVERDRADQLGRRRGQRLHLGLVVVEVAVAGAAGGQPARADALGEGPVGGAVAARLRREVGDLGRVPQPGVAQLLEVAGAIGDDLDEAVAAVLGQVKPERVEQRLGRGRRSLHAHQRGALVLRPGGQRDGERAQARARCAARAPAGLEHQLAAAAGEALGELARAEAGRGRDRAPAALVEDREVPVAGGRFEPRAGEAGRRHRDRLLRVAAAAVEQLRPGSRARRRRGRSRKSRGGRRRMRAPRRPVRSRAPRGRPLFELGA